MWDPSQAGEQPTSARPDTLAGIPLPTWSTIIVVAMAGRTLEYMGV